MKSFKCSNCGSTKYTQVKEDKYICAYCETEFEFLSAEKSAFEKNLSSATLKKGVQVYNAEITEDAFYKNALMQLTMNKTTPIDVLEKSKFSFVKYRYIYFASCEINYYQLSHISVNSLNKKTVSLADSQMARYLSKVTKCVPITKDCLPEQINLIMSDYDTGLLDQYATTVGFGKDEKIKCPDQSEVERCIEMVAENFRDIVKSENAVGDVIYRVEKVQLFAVPEYSLEFNYNNTSYTLSSFAHRLNIVGTMPNSQEYKQSERKKMNPVNLITMIICLVMSTYSVLQMLFFNYYGLLTLDIILLILSIVIYVMNLSINMSIEKMVKKKYFETKRDNLIKHLSSKDIETTLNDKEFINSFLRRY
jgi:hypothetical protein